MTCWKNAGSIGDVNTPTPDPTADTRYLWQIALPVLSATVLAALAFWAVWQEIERRRIERAAAQLEFDARDLTQKVEQRMRAHRQVLRGARALFNASDEVTVEDWTAYVVALSLHEDFPGIQGVGFSRHVPAAELEDHIRAMRKAGVSDYAIRPSGQRPEYSSIVYLTPLDWRNRRALHFDMMSEPVRREAMNRARLSGEAALSGKVRLVQETDQDTQTGVLLYLPTYRRELPVDTDAERAAALIGWVYSPFRMRDLMRGTLGSNLHALRLRIYDDGRDDPTALLYDSHEDDPVRSAALTRKVERDIDGRRWLLVFEQRSEAASDLDRWRTELALVVVFGILVVTLAAGLGHSRRRAAQLAELGRSLSRSERMYATLVNLSGEGILSVDPGGRVEYANPGLHRMLGLDDDTLTGRPIETLTGDGHRHAVTAMSTALLSGESVRMELTLQGHGDCARVVLASGVPRTDTDGQVTGAIVVLADISERKADEARIAWLATHDGLTGLPNRSLLTDRLKGTLISSRRYRRPFCLLFVDLDHFKEVNDRMGHQAGDAVLIEASRRMQACLRASDTLARYGGDEFVALLPETDSLESACAVAEKIRSRLGAAFVLDTGRVQISASIGVVMCPEHGDDLEDLVCRADEAMYGAKADGRNTIAVWKNPDNKDNP